MYKASYVAAAILLSVPLAASPARADNESCASAQAEGQRYRQSEMMVNAQHAFSRCAQPECPLSVRQDCERSRAELGSDSPLPAVSLVAPGPNMAVTLQLRPGHERAAEHARRLKLASYGLAFSGLAVGGLSLAAGLRGREIENACASEESCSHSLAAHGRTLYRSADAGAAIAGVCGISAAILLWRFLTVSSPDGFRVASAEEHRTSVSSSSWLFVF